MSKDSIVVLTCIAWAAITTSAQKVSYDLQTKTWHCSSTLRVYTKSSFGTGEHKERRNHENEIY